MKKKIGKYFRKEILWEIIETIYGEDYMFV
jgi:hypothetical protein